MPRHHKSNKERRAENEIDEDLQKAYWLWRRARTPQLKQTYYKLWYAILVIKHKSYIGATE